MPAPCVAFYVPSFPLGLETQPGLWALGTSAGPSCPGAGQPCLEKPPAQPVRDTWGGCSGPEVPSYRSLDLTPTLAAVWVQFSGRQAAWGLSSPGLATLVFTGSNTCAGQAPHPPPEWGAQQNPRTRVGETKVWNAVSQPGGALWCPESTGCTCK